MQLETIQGESIGCAIVDDTVDVPISDKKLEKENESLVRNTIRSTSNIDRTMEQLPAPSEFWKLLVLCLLTFVASLAIAVTEYLLFADIFTELNEEVEIMAYQSDQYRTLSEGSSIVLQAVSLQE